MEEFTVGFGNSYGQLGFEMYRGKRICTSIYHLDSMYFEVLGTSDIPQSLNWYPIPILMVLGDHSLCFGKSSSSLTVFAEANIFVDIGQRCN